MVTQGLEGIDALLIHDATGDLPAGILQASRAWPDDDWNAAHARLQARGWLSDEGGLTDDGRAARAWVETTTDELMLRCWEPLGDDACRRLRALVRPYSRVISEQELSRPAFPADE
jgi:hypothetical protein